MENALLDYNQRSGRLGVKLAIVVLITDVYLILGQQRFITKTYVLFLE